MNKPMKKKKPPMEDSAAPFPNGKEAAPHYTDTIDPELTKTYAAQCGTFRARFHEDAG